MIALANLGQNKKGKLWVNDLPDLNYKIINRLTTSIDIEKSMYIKPTSIALELLLSRRDMSNYAFLGIKFMPKNIKNLNIRVNISSEEDEILSDNIAMKSDTVFLGIPNEYAEAIIDTTNKVVREHSLFPCGDLDFFIGAHGEIGSSKFSFSKVTESIS
ncbi:hypothetical protein ACQKII_04525 [Lysinibacillus sp. NPDC048646]|uniref:hypothetical protein n=1 Tax=Lysinibacillus sp. NPDC048646 TaxID=3390574 RepID=UPI003D093624